MRRYIKLILVIISCIVTLGLASILRFCLNPKSNQEAIIGGADNPTSIHISGNISFGDNDEDADIVDGEIKYSMITMEEAVGILAEDGDYVILDVRRADEFAGGHIPGAINIANEDIGMDPPEALPDKEQTIYVYCRSGNRSKQAAGKLAALGYENVVEFGGIIDWPGEIEK